MASIHHEGTYSKGPHKGKPRYRVQYRTPAGKMRASFFPSKKAAQAFAGDVEAAKRRGAFVDPADARITLADYWQRWRAQADELGKPRASTLANYDQVWRVYVGELLGARQLGSIRRRDVAEMVSKVAERSKHQAHTALKLTRMLLNRALDDELIVVNRAARVQTPAIERSRPDVLTPEQLAALVEATDPRYRALVLLNAWGGFRWSEVVCLEVGAVDFLRRQVRVNRAVVQVEGRLVAQDAKTLKSQRTIPLPRFVVDALAEHVQLYPPVETSFGTLLFTTETGRPIHRNHFQRRVWKPAISRAGLDGFKIRHLRHTGASLVLAAGGNLKDVAERLGHTTTRMADELYVELYESRGRELVARMEALASGDEATAREVVR